MSMLCFSFWIETGICVDDNSFGFWTIDSNMNVEHVEWDGMYGGVICVYQVQSKIKQSNQNVVHVCDQIICYSVTIMYILWHTHTQS